MNDEELKKEFHVWATSPKPLIRVIEVFSVDELSSILNAIFEAELFVIKVESFHTEFWRTWTVLYGNTAGKDCLLRTAELSLADADQKKQTKIKGSVKQ